VLLKGRTLSPRCCTHPCIKGCCCCCSDSCPPLGTSTSSTSMAEQPQPQPDAGEEEQPPRGYRVAFSKTFRCPYFYDPSSGRTQWPEHPPAADRGGASRGRGGWAHDQQRQPKRPRQEVADLAERISGLIAEDDRVGFPQEEPTVQANPHGWFFPPHKVRRRQPSDFVLRLASWRQEKLPCKTCRGPTELRACCRSSIAARW
jgi:hypothetical protein